MTTYDRLLLHDGRRVILRDLREGATKTGALAGLTTLRGYAVDRFGNDIETKTATGVALHLWMVTPADIKKRTPLRVNLKYDTLETAPRGDRRPYYPGRERTA